MTGQRQLIAASFMAWAKKTSCSLSGGCHRAVAVIDIAVATDSNEVVFCQFCEILFIGKLVNLIEKPISIGLAHSRCSSPEFGGVKPYAQGIFGVHTLRLVSLEHLYIATYRSGVHILTGLEQWTRFIGTALIVNAKSLQAFSGVFIIL